MDSGTGPIFCDIMSQKIMEVAIMEKRILRSDRIRCPGGRFSFIPHRFLLDGFLKTLTRDELSLYMFLTLASDKNGISYYGQKSTCNQLQMQKNDYVKARDGLIYKDLIASDGVFFQVLELPEKPIALHRINQDMLNSLCQTIGKEG